MADGWTWEKPEQEADAVARELLSLSVIGLGIVAFLLVAACGGCS